MSEKTKAAWLAAKKSAKRELMLHAGMLIFSLAVLAVALPIVWLISFLPDWIWFVFVVAWIVWVFFSDTIAAAFHAYRGEDR